MSTRESFLLGMLAGAALTASLVKLFEWVL